LAKTLYVGNLPYSVTDSQLQTHFAEYGGTNVRIIEGRGFAFVDVAEDQLQTAINDKHDQELGGRRLTVNEARPKTESNRSGGGGGGNRYGGGGGGGGGGGRNRW